MYKSDHIECIMRTLVFFLNEAFSIQTPTKQSELFVNAGLSEATLQAPVSRALSVNLGTGDKGFFKRTHSMYNHTTI